MRSIIFAAVLVAVVGCGSSDGKVVTSTPTTAPVAVAPKPPVVAEQPKVERVVKKEEPKPVPAKKQIEPFPFKVANARIEAKKESITDIISDYTNKEWAVTLKVVDFGPNGVAGCDIVEGYPTWLRLPKGTKIGDTIKGVVQFIDHDEYHQNTWQFRFVRAE